MKLYFAPGACSLSPHIVLRELGYAFDLEQVDLLTKRTKSGADYLRVNPKGYVPALLLDDGKVLTEGPAILQYLADRKNDARLQARPVDQPRYRVIEWLHFVGTELHKGFSPLWSPATPQEYRVIARANLAKRYTVVEEALKGTAHIAGEAFSLADAYLFTITNWADLLKFDLAPYPALRAYMARVAVRPAVQAALKAEGLVKEKAAAG